MKFYDFDKDLDKDVLIKYGNFNYTFENQGTLSNPLFVFSQVNVFDSSLWTGGGGDIIFCDLDSDTDMDVFIQYADKTTAYFENQRIIMGVEQIEEKSTEQLAEIAKNQALMVMCLQ